MTIRNDYRRIKIANLTNLSDSQVIQLNLFLPAWLGNSQGNVLEAISNAADDITEN